MKVLPTSEETLDAVCGVQLFQRAQGYRFNLDSVLLAHFAAQWAPAVRGGRSVDLGSGVGIIPLILARKFGWSDLTALELQPGLHRLAERNVQLNRMEGKVRPLQGDLRRVSGLLPAEAFDTVLCNPPYRPVREGRVAPDEEKAIAKHEIACSLQDVLKASGYLLSTRGSALLIVPVARLEELLVHLRDAGFSAQTLRLVHPREDRPAKLALLAAGKGSRTKLSALPPLVLHRGREQAFSPEVEAMLQAEPGPPLSGK